MKNVDVKDRCAGAIATGEPGGGGEGWRKEENPKIQVVDDVCPEVRVGANKVVGRYVVGFGGGSKSQMGRQIRCCWISIMVCVCSIA